MFAPELPDLDRDRIREWYNGYGWRGEERVYNPFDILLLFDEREFEPWWFETGTPAFLVETLFARRVSSLGLDVTVEDSTSHGRLDMAVRFNGNVYLFEFKVVEMAPEGAAMAQLKEKRYADKYRDAGVPIHLVAVEFSKDARNVVAFDIEPG